MCSAQMTSRERVLASLNHQQPDRVPFNLGLTIDIHNQLREYLNLPPEREKSIGYWTNVSPSIDLLEAMKVDIYRFGLNPPVHWQAPDEENGLLYDEWGIGRRKVEHQSGYYYEMVSHPLEGCSLEDIEAHPWPDPRDPGRVAGLREKILEIRSETDLAIMAKFSNSIWEQSWWLYGLEPWLMALATTPEVPCTLMDKLTGLAMEFATVGLEEVGDLIDILRLSGEDLGTQFGPMISPQMYEEYVEPRFRRYWKHAKDLFLEKNPHGKIMLHSCGSVRSFVPSWIEMGLDILDPIQPLVEGMDPAGLKRDFGEELVFHGGIDIQHLLPFGTRDQVMSEVRRYIETLGDGGGYIVAPAHNVQSDVPPENLVAIRDAVQFYGEALG